MSRKSCQLIFKQLLPPVHRACRLVPELTLSILTSSNPLWHIPYGEAMKQLDRDDPWWAFLWPGSQALCRYILDNKRLLKDSRVLDIGCGCGASSIAAKLAGAVHVTANDIDDDALTATQHNSQLNDISIDDFSSKNILIDSSIISGLKSFDWIVIGDMCYDDELAKQILQLIDLVHHHKIRILLADPGRHSFRKIVSDQLKTIMKPLEEYPIVDEDYIEIDFKSIQVWSNH